MLESDMMKGNKREGSDEIGTIVSDLRKAAAGAPERLCDAFGERIFRFVASRLPGDAQLAEELMLLTMVDTVRQIKHYTPRQATFSAWVYGLARRHIQTELRKRYRRNSVPVRAEVNLETALAKIGGEDPAIALNEQIAARHQVALLKSQLNEDEMEILTLKYVHDFSVREISHILQRSERAIVSRLYRAREKARERLMNDETGR